MGVLAAEDIKIFGEGRGGAKGGSRGLAQEARCKEVGQDVAKDDR